MQVRIRLYLTFKGRAPDGESPYLLELPDGATVDEALASLSIRSSEAKVVLINGRLSQGGATIKDGDHLTVFPPLEGG